MHNLLDFIIQWPIWGQILAGQVLLFTIPTGIAFVFLYKWPQNPFHKRKIQPFSIQENSLSQEVKYSLQTSLIFALKTDSDDKYSE